MKQVFLYFIVGTVIFMVVAILLLIYYQDFIAMLSSFDEMAGKSNKLVLHLIGSFLWTCLFVMLQPIAIWGFIFLLVLISWYCIKKGFEGGISDGVRILSGTLIPFFVFVFLINSDSAILKGLSESEDIGIITNISFLIALFVSYAIFRVINKIKDKFKYFAFLSGFSFTALLSILSSLKLMTGTPGLAIAMGIATGFLLNILLHGLDENQPIYGIIEGGINKISNFGSVESSNNTVEEESS